MKPRRRGSSELYYVVVIITLFAISIRGLYSYYSNIKIIDNTKNDWENLSHFL